jgi:hypothetical protein
VRAGRLGFGRVSSIRRSFVDSRELCGFFDSSRDRGAVEREVTSREPPSSVVGPPSRSPYLRGKDSNSTRQLDRQSKTPRHRQMGQGPTRPRKVQAPEPRFCPNPLRRRGGGTAQGRMSRDVAASMIHVHTQGTLPALVGAFFSRRPCMNPLPCPDLSRKQRFFSWTDARRATAP